QLRSELRRKSGDNAGAKSDEDVILQANIKRFSQSNSKQDSSEKTRKKSDKNLKNYRKLMVDDEQEDNKYESAYRGKIQDKKVKVQLEKMFVLSYYQKIEEIKRQVNYYRAIDELNQTAKLPNRLLITNRERALGDKEIKEQFIAIEETSARIADNPTTMLYFRRSMNYYLVQDFENAIADLTKLLVQNDTFFPAYFQRALIRYKQLEYKKANRQPSLEGQLEVANTSAVDYEIVRNDLDKVIELAPDFVYAYYNRANLLTLLEDYPAALVDYSKAIELYPNFSEAYYNRGLTYLYTGDKKRAFDDLSKAGELGIALAYNVLKKFAGHDEY
ncbi:MAG: tetratricopeptide repeat protein, partial [Bacteroidaceae bacterium]|nr:tetratricopeptide repeat protein [Bacteroidaceae bacterium]